MRFNLAMTRWSILIVVLLLLGYYIPATRNMVVSTMGPFVRLARQGGESLLGVSSTIRSIPRLARENGVLQARVTELHSLETINKELKHENDLLRKELSLSSSSDIDAKLAAQVISRSSSVSLQSITINKGTKDGFGKGMAVIAQGYLVGYVDEVLPATSKVKLLSSVDSLLPVVLQDSRSVGLLKGTTEGLIIDEIPRDVSIKQGEGIVTSNVGDVIKSGIPVGSVATVVSGKSDVYQSARVHSPIDLSRLEVVFGVR